MGCPRLNIEMSIAATAAQLLAMVSSVSGMACSALEAQLSLRSASLPAQAAGQERGTLARGGGQALQLSSQKIQKRGGTRQTQRAREIQGARSGQGLGQQNSRFGLCRGSAGCGRDATRPQQAGQELAHDILGSRGETGQGWPRGKQSDGLHSWQAGLV